VKVDTETIVKPDATLAANHGARQAAPLLELRDLKVHFPIERGAVLKRRVGRVKAVDGVTLDVQPGETFAVVGESGSGKSTLGRAIVRLYRPTGGTILFDGVDVGGLARGQLTDLRRRMQMIFQDPYASLHPRMKIGQIVAEPLEIHSVGTAQSRRARVVELLDDVGLAEHFAKRYPHELSGGQRQRVAIARAIALNPDLIVADEPTSALDISIQGQIIKLLGRLQAERELAYLFITHNLSLVRHFAQRVAVMYLGRVVERAPTRLLFERPLHPYTIALLSAVPVPDPEVESARKRIILPGVVPSPAAPPPGCPFHTRCWLRERLGRPEECEAIEPPPRSLGSHPVACHFAEEAAGSPEQAEALKSDTAADRKQRPEEDCDDPQR
jgi:oligopeptide/dipeptide ABC transporter ATP-binding protein